jgi:hypothetical protein
VLGQQAESGLVEERYEAKTTAKSANQPRLSFGQGIAEAALPDSCEDDKSADGAIAMIEAPSLRTICWPLADVYRFPTLPLSLRHGKGNARVKNVSPFFARVRSDSRRCGQEERP